MDDTVLVFSPSRRLHSSPIAIFWLDVSSREACSNNRAVGSARDYFRSSCVSLIYRLSRGISSLFWSMYPWLFSLRHHPFASCPRRHCTPLLSASILSWLGRLQSRWNRLFFRRLWSSSNSWKTGVCRGFSLLRCTNAWMLRAFCQNGYVSKV
jgi:hypothetical protein